MKIDTKVVDELSHLARLSYENEAKQEIVTELNKIIAFVMYFFLPLNSTTYLPTFG